MRKLKNWRRNWILTAEIAEKEREYMVGQEAAEVLQTKKATITGGARICPSGDRGVCIKKVAG